MYHIFYADFDFNDPMIGHDTCETIEEVGETIAKSHRYDYNIVVKGEVVRPEDYKLFYTRMRDQLDEEQRERTKILLEERDLREYERLKAKYDK